MIGWFVFVWFWFLETGSHCRAHTGLKVAILLPWLPESRSVPPYLAPVVVKICKFENIIHFIQCALEKNKTLLKIGASQWGLPHQLDFPNSCSQTWKLQSMGNILIDLYMTTLTCICWFFIINTKILFIVTYYLDQEFIKGQNRHLIFSSFSVYSH